jgi:hypothetical protein
LVLLRWPKEIGPNFEGDGLASSDWESAAERRDAGAITGGIKSGYRPPHQFKKCNYVNALAGFYGSSPGSQQNQALIEKPPSSLNRPCRHCVGKPIAVSLNLRTRSALAI